MEPTLLLDVEDIPINAKDTPGPDNTSMQVKFSESTNKKHIICYFQRGR